MVEFKDVAEGRVTIAEWIHCNCTGMDVIHEFNSCILGLKAKAGEYARDLGRTIELLEGNKTYLAYLITYSWPGGRFKVLLRMNEGGQFYEVTEQAEDFMDDAGPGTHKRN